MTGIIWCISAAVRIVRDREVSAGMRLPDMLFIEVMVILSALFWFFSAPLIRYGYLYLILLPAVTAAVIINDGGMKKAFKVIIPLAFVSVILYPGIKLLRTDFDYIRHNWSSAYALYQKDYPTADVGEHDFYGITFYYPKDPGTPVWYDAFPSVLYEDNFSSMEYFDGTLKGGFKLTDPE